MPVRLKAYQRSAKSLDRQQDSTCTRISILVRTDRACRRCKGKVVIVTGCNSPLGIGRASAHQYAENGAKAIFICDLKDDNLETHKRELNSLYPDVEVNPRKVDAADEASVKAVVDEAIQKYGRLDVFFANAGISSGKLFWDYSSDEFMHMMKVNALRFVFWLLLLMRALTSCVASSWLPSSDRRR
jgi:NAD(P)-dependent dehydrogenase (short-subunit alcohol dehydrogenase family)